MLYTKGVISAVKALCVRSECTNDSTEHFGLRACESLILKQPVVFLSLRKLLRFLFLTRGREVISISRRAVFRVYVIAYHSIVVARVPFRNHSFRHYKSSSNAYWFRYNRDAGCFFTD